MDSRSTLSYVEINKYLNQLSNQRREDGEFLNISFPLISIFNIIKRKYIIVKIFESNKYIPLQNCPYMIAQTSLSQPLE